VIYEEVDGWKEDISDVRKYSELPKNAKRYIEKIEEKIGKKISKISTGSSREQMIQR